MPSSNGNGFRYYLATAVALVLALCGWIAAVQGDVNENHATIVEKKEVVSLIKTNCTYATDAKSIAVQLENISEANKQNKTEHRQITDTLAEISGDLKVIKAELAK